MKQPRRRYGWPPQRFAPGDRVRIINGPWVPDIIGTVIREIPENELPPGGHVAIYEIVEESELSPPPLWLATPGRMEPA